MLAQEIHGGKPFQFVTDAVRRPAPFIIDILHGQMERRPALCRREFRPLGDEARPERRRCILFNIVRRLGLLRRLEIGKAPLQTGRRQL